MMLVKAGSNVNAKGLDDDTPLHDAATMGQLKLVKLLVERGADPCFKNKKGKTPCDVSSAPSVYNYLKGKLHCYVFRFLFALRDRIFYFVRLEIHSLKIFFRMITKTFFFCFIAIASFILL